MPLPLKGSGRGPSRPGFRKKRYFCQPCTHRLLCHRHTAAGLPLLLHKGKFRTNLQQLETEFARILSGSPYGDEPGVLQHSRLDFRTASFRKGLVD